MGLNPADSLTALANEIFHSIGSERTCHGVAAVAGAQGLQGRSILMVDDNPVVIEPFVEGLVGVTGGHAGALLHKGESAQALADRIVTINPAVTLMDYELKGDLLGNEVVRCLRNAGYKGTVIGFSNYEGNWITDRFREAGADSYVRKQHKKPLETLQALARTIALLPS